jgi:signal transduction histidine kinase
MAEVDGLLATFSALLRIAQIEAGARRSAFHPVDLTDTIRTVCEAYAPTIEDGGRPFEVVLAPSVTVEGDRELLTQLFANLLENAIWHTPAGAAIRVELERGCDGRAGHAGVSDAGPVIPASERETVLRRFYRLERSRTTPGNGLGLSMAATIAELHQARVTLSDNEPGLRVGLSFPLAG